MLLAVLRLKLGSLHTLSSSTYYNWVHFASERRSDETRRRRSGIVLAFPAHAGSARFSGVF